MAQFANYLKASRKRLGLSQDEVAYLLGTDGGAKVCRYERFIREPSLETALALELILQTPTHELFDGLYHQIEHHVAERAKILARKYRGQKPNPSITRKLQTLADIIANSKHQ